MAESAVRERIRDASGWNIQKQLGRGQYGTAYLVGATPETTNKDEQAVAKVVGLEFLPEKEHKIAFQEVEMMRALSHRYIVLLNDHFFTEDNLELVMVMEYCDQGDLRGEVKRRSQAKPIDHIAEAQLMIWFVQLTLALNYIHQRHILHRDLKSSNIFMTTGSDKSSGLDVKIGDFGISRVLEGTVDVAATVVGTPYYMSPEVCKAEPYGYKSDIWALGCVLYEMCMLKHAFESQSLLGLVYKIVSETYDPIPDVYTADLRSLLERVLDKSHFSRPTGKELVVEPFVKKYIPKDLEPTAGGKAGAAKAEAPGPGAVTTSSGAPKKPAPPRTSLGATLNAQKKKPVPLGSAMRMPEASPPPPDVMAGGAMPGAVGSTAPEENQHRRWAAPPAGPTKQLEEGEFRVQVLLGRIRRALAVRRQNWLQVFASFDKAGNGRLPEAEFDRAVTSMALGLSDQEISEVRRYLLLKSGGNCVPVDAFGKALHGSFPEVQRVESWARNTLAELSREATKVAGGTNSVGPGASVRVQGLQSAVGVKLNGCEGIVEKWDATSSRWVVRLVKGELKSIRDEHLQILRPAPSSSCPVEQDTAAIYRLLCEGGETAVPEANFFGAVKPLLPKLSESDLRQLLLLLPKSSDGRIDVPEVLAQFLVGFVGDQTMQMGGPLFPSSGPGVGQGMPGPDFSQQPPQSPSKPMRPAPPQRPTPNNNRGPQPNSVPGSVESPRHSPKGKASLQGAAGGKGGSGGGRGGGNAGGGASSAMDRAVAEVSLLRLAQKLMGRPAQPGPGTDLLRLFAGQPDEVRLDELSEAVSILPLGISRSEVQLVFAHLSGYASETLNLMTLVSAVETAYNAGTPAEAATLDGINIARLAGALQRLDSAGHGSGRATVMEFRVTVMQAEPYLTANQLEWLMALTDKDGEGRLLPRSLLVRLGAGPANPRSGGSLMVPPRPNGASRNPIAPHTSRSQVVAAIIARIRDRLFSSGPQLTLERVLSIFEIGSERGASTSRETLACLLGHMRLGISVAEADELCTAIACASVGAGGVSLALHSLYDFVQRGGDADEEALVDELREAVRDRFLGRGNQFADAAMRICGPRAEGGDWLPESDFRWCLAQALVEDGIQATPMVPDDEDRAVLLAEKSAAGTVRWRQFASTHIGWHDDDYVSDPGNISPKKGAAPGPLPSTTQQTFHQTWRSAKTVPERNVTAPSPEKELRNLNLKEPPGAPMKMVSEKQPGQGGLCRCITRLFGGGGKQI